MDNLFAPAAPTLYKWALQIVMSTCRIKWYGNEYIPALKQSHQPWIWAAWHDNISVAIWSVRQQGIAMLASESRDGDFIAKVLQAFGNTPVRGSSSRGSRSATRNMLRALSAGNNASITPDGPRGPRYELKPGVLWLAIMADCPILTWHHEAERQWQMTSSWDRHRIPKPFTTVHICIGEPYWVDRDLLKRDEAAVVQEFHQHMMKNTERACRLAGQRIPEEIRR